MEAALDHFKVAIALAERHHYERQRGMLLVASQTSADRGDFIDALERYNQAIAVSKNLQDNRLRTPEQWVFKPRPRAYDRI